MAVIVGESSKLTKNSPEVLVIRTIQKLQIIKELTAIASNHIIEDRESHPLYMVFKTLNDYIDNALLDLDDYCDVIMLLTEQLDDNSFNDVSATED